MTPASTDIAVVFSPASVSVAGGSLSRWAACSPTRPVWWVGRPPVVAGDPVGWWLSGQQDDGDAGGDGYVDRDYDQDARCGQEAERLGISWVLHLYALSVRGWVDLPILSGECEAGAVFCVKSVFIQRCAAHACRGGSIG